MPNLADYLTKSKGQRIREEKMALLQKQILERREFLSQNRKGLPIEAKALHEKGITKLAKKLRELQDMD